MEMTIGKNLHREAGPVSDEAESAGDREKTRWSEIGAP